MNVASNVPGIVTGTGLPGGNIEFWRSNYATDNLAGVPNANAATYDCGDNAGGPSGGGTYGSFQLHNHDALQTLFAYNRWNDGVTQSDLGIGNNTQTTDDNRVNGDWTFTGNAGDSAIRRCRCSSARAHRCALRSCRSATRSPTGQAARAATEPGCSTTSRQPAGPSSSSAAAHRHQRHLATLQPRRQRQAG